MNSAIQNAGDLAINQAMNPSLSSRFMRKDSNHSIDKAAKDFEGMFMAQMLQPMFETVGVDPMFGGGHGEEVMRNFLVQEYGKAIASHSNFKIADAVRAEMIRAQETQNPHTQNPTFNGATDAAGSIQ